MNPLIAAVGVVLVMTVVVAATMVVENWRELVRPVPVGGRDAEESDLVVIERPLDHDAPVADDDVEELVAVDAPDVLALEADVAAAAALGAVDGDGPVGAIGVERLDDPLEERHEEVRRRAAAAVHVPPGGAPEGAIAVSERSIELRDRATADVLAALLLAAFSATRRSGADRAAAWVTASATPPSADPERFPPGVRLRGRPAKVAELLDHRDGGAVWVTMQHQVDIARGLARSPVTQPTLAGIVAWWSSTRDLPAVVEPEVAARVASSIDAVRDRLDETTWSEVVGRLRDALGAAAEDGEPLLVSLADDEDVPAGAGAGVAVSADPTRAAPTR